MLNLYKPFIGFFLSLFISHALYAQNSYDDLLKSIDDELQTYEKTATQTKKNEHYQPYIVSVLEGETMMKLGFITLEDALGIIPGVDISSDNLDYKSATFRGSNPIAFGQSKLLIDGVLVNNVFFDGYSEYLDMPIELIKRVEVIRGSGNEGSEVASYAGSINVITYAEDMSEDGLVFAKIGSDKFRSGGFRKGYKEGDFSLFTDLYYQEHDKKVHTQSNAFKSGIYNFQTPFYTIDNSPLSSSADAPLWLKNYSLGLSMQYEEFSFKGRIYQYEHGSSFGFNYVVPEDDGSLHFPNHYGEFAYTKEFNNVKLIAKAGIKYNGIESEAKLASDGLTLPKVSNPKQTVTFDNGMQGEHQSKQRTLYHGVDIYHDGIEHHQFSASYYLSKIDTTKILSKITNLDSGVGIVDYTDTLPFFDIDASRETYILTVGDKYDYSDFLQLLFGVNIEKNTHIDTQINPKLSLVYHTKKDNIFKVLYTSSHRSPSWQEIYTLNNRARVGNRNLEAERIHTIEGSYIKHFSHDSFIQTTLFYLINQNQIHNITENNQYINSEEDNHLYGVEVEYKGKLTPNDSIYLNLSYIDGKNSYDQTLSQVAHLLLKGYYIYNLQENLSLSTVAKYSTHKHRISYDNREDVAGSAVIDSTLSFYNYANKYRVSLGIKNILDKDLSYMSKPYTYEEDYPISGRSFALSFSKEF